MTYKPYIGTEDQFQIAVAKYLDAKGVLWCHPPNGGSRNKAEAGKLKGMGTKRGVPDVLIFTPNVFYNGMAIELKVGKNTPTKEQLEWGKSLTMIGWYMILSYSLDEVIDLVDKYLNTAMK